MTLRLGVMCLTLATISPGTPLLSQDIGRRQPTAWWKTNAALGVSQGSTGLTNAVFQRSLEPLRARPVPVYPSLAADASELRVLLSPTDAGLVSVRIERAVAVPEPPRAGMLFAMLVLLALTFWAAPVSKR